MTDQQWADISDNEIIPVVGDYEHGGFNQSAPSATPAAPSPGPASPRWVDVADHEIVPVGTQAPAGQAPLNDSGQMVGSFGDEPGPREAATRATPEEEAHIIQMTRNGASADDLRRYAASIGFAGPDNFDAVVAARDKGGGVNPNFLYHLPTPLRHTVSGAFTRGVGDAVSMSFLPRLGAVADELGIGGDGHRETVWNSKHSFGELYDRNLDINNGILDADEANHPYARLTGQIIGNLAIPIGGEGIALEAGKSVLRLGGTMREARAAAAAAVRNRMATIGAGMGAAHGAGESEGGPGHMLLGGAVGGLEGAAGAYGLTAAGQAVAEHAPPIWAGIKGAASKVGDGGEPVPETPDYGQIARDMQIRRTPATAGGPVTRGVQNVFSVMPGGSLAVDSAKAAEVNDVGAAARRVAESVGTPGTRQEAGSAIAQGAEDYRKTSSAEGGSLYDQRDALMGGTSAPVPMDQTHAALTKMASDFPTSPAIGQLREHPVIRAIEGGLPSDGQPLTLGEATEGLSHVRSVSRNLAARGDASAPILARVDQLKNAMNADVMAAAGNVDVAAGKVPGEAGSAVAAQKGADAYWADRKAALNGALKKPLASASNPEAVSGESVYNQVSRNMNADNGNVAALRDQWFRLPQEARSTFAATKIDDMGRATPGNQDETAKVWSYDKFLDNWNALSPQARNIVFGAGAEKQLGQIAAYASRLRQTGGSGRITSRIQQVFNTVFVGGIVGSMMHGDFAHAAETAVGGGASFLGAHLFLATPKMRDWTVQAMKAVSNAAQGQNNETAFKVLTKRLGNIAASEPSIADQALGLQRHIMQAVNDNTVSRIAASPDAGGKKQNQQPK